MSRSMSLSFVHLTGSCGAEQDNPVRVRDAQHAPHNLAQQAVIDTHSVIIVCRRPAWKLAGSGRVHACIQFVSLLCFVESQ